MMEIKHVKHSNAGFVWLCIAFIVISALEVLLFGSTKSHEFLFFKFVLFLIQVTCGFLAVQGIVKIPNSPPHYAVKTRLENREWKEDAQGNYIPVLLNEGYNWLALKGMYFGYVLVPKYTREVDFPKIIVTTPDGATTEIPGSIAYENDPDDSLNYLNHETPTKTAQQNVEDILTSVWQDALRQWAITNEEPRTWEELHKSGAEAIKIIVTSLTSDHTIDENTLNQIMAGSGKLLIKHLGIRLKKVKLGNMLSSGEIYDADIKKKKETIQRGAETYEVDTDLTIAGKLKEAYEKMGFDASLNDCLNQYMEWKIRREGIEKFSIAAITDIISTNLNRGNKNDTRKH